jgi:hypothetical protein
MATKRVQQEDDKLDATHFEHVIKMLEGEKPWTKKECCGYLGIAYNTTRLATLIDKYKEGKAKDAARRAEKRGTPATQAEIEFTVKEYLEGATVDSISKSLFRGPAFVNAVLNKCSVPIRNTSFSYFRPGLVPDEAIRERFKIGEKVYSMRYDSLATIDQAFSPGVYRLYLLADKWRQYCYQPAEELASLEPIRKLGINI